MRKKKKRKKKLNIKSLTDLKWIEKGSVEEVHSFVTSRVKRSPQIKVLRRQRPFEKLVFNPWVLD